MPRVVSLPDRRAVHMLTSGAYTLSKPTITYPELIPSDLQQALSQNWSTPHGPRPILFHSLLDVYVVGEGLVFDKEFNLLSPSITQNPEAAIENGYTRLLDGLRSGTVPRLSGPLLLCGKAGLNNYGHWLAEMLPLVHLSAHWIEQPHGWRVLVPQVYPWMSAVIEDSLDLLGAGSERRILNDGQPCFVSELVFVEGLSQHGAYFSPLILEAMDRIRDQVQADNAPRLWVTREGETRALMEEVEANARLAAAGWRVVHPGKITFREQVAFAKGARHIAGVNGAGLSNLLFMNPGGALTSFVPAVMPDVFYWQLSGHRGLCYSEIRSAQRHELGGPTIWDAPLTITVDEVVKHLETVDQSLGM